MIETSKLVLKKMSGLVRLKISLSFLNLLRQLHALLTKLMSYQRTQGTNHRSREAQGKQAIASVEGKKMILLS